MHAQCHKQHTSVDPWDDYGMYIEDSKVGVAMCWSWFISTVV